MTDARCIADREDGQICGEPATVLDPQRGGMVCGAHAPPKPIPKSAADKLNVSALEGYRRVAEKDGIVEDARARDVWLRSGSPTELSTASELLPDGTITDTLQGQSHVHEENTYNVAWTLIAA